MTAEKFCRSKRSDGLVTGWQGEVTLQVWKLAMENFGEFLHTRSRGLGKTYDLVGLFHELQSVHDGTVDGVVLPFATTRSLVLLVYHLQSHTIINIIFTLNTISDIHEIPQIIPKTCLTSFVSPVGVVSVCAAFSFRLPATQSSGSCASDGCV